jgi:hypothetical protein
MQILFAITPSFSRSEILGPKSGWDIYPVKIDRLKIFHTPDNTSLYVSKNATDKSQCETNNKYNSIGNFPSGNISSVSYQGDGKKLNATIWLDEPFREPPFKNIRSNSTFVNASSASQVYFRTDIAKVEDKDLNTTFNDEKIYLNHTEGNFNLYKPGFTTINGTSAIKFLYTHDGNSIEPCKFCISNETMTIKDGKLYRFLYTADKTKFFQFSPIIQNIIQSINIGKNTTNYLTYQDSLNRLKINYPSDWIKNVNSRSNLFNTTFNSQQINNAGYPIASISLGTSESDQILNGDLQYKPKIFQKIFNSSKSNHANTNSILADYRGYRIKFSSNFNGINRTTIESGALIGSKVFYIVATIDSDQYYKYVPIIQKMIESFQINNSKSFITNVNNNKLPSNFIKYKNLEFGGIEMNYPENWSGYTNNSNPSSFVIFAPSGSFKSNAPLVSLGFSNPHKTSNLETALNHITNYYRQNTLKNVHIIESDLNSTYLGGYPAFKVVVTASYKNQNRTVMIIGAFIGSKLYQFEVMVSPDEYPTYLPIIQKMIDSFKVNNPIITNSSTNSAINDIIPYQDVQNNLNLQYPSNWIKIHSMPAYGNNSDITKGVGFFSPVEGPYLLEKDYGMWISFDSPYGRETPYFYDIGYTNYNGWSKQIIEYSKNKISKQTILIPHKYDGFAKDGGNYVDLSFDLTSLNLPHQFKLSFNTVDRYINNDHLCNLAIYTDWVSVPPPIYHVSTAPTSLSMRSGEEKPVQIQIKSGQDLPFNATFSSDKIDGLDLKFQPNQTSGIPIPDINTTSNLNIRAIDIIPGAYTIPINVMVKLEPTVNNIYGLKKTKPVVINKTIDFTLSILPPLSIAEQLGNMWTTMGIPLTGFVGLLTAIGGVFGGWFLKHLKNNRDKNNADYKNHYTER